MKTRSIFLIVLFSTCLASAKDLPKANNSAQVVVEIDFGKEKAAKTVSVDYTQNLTALEALQKCAIVKTEPLENLVFVTGIDYVNGKRGEMAWYYKINSENTKKLAISQLVEPGDTIQWRYVKDVCSATVDCKRK